MNELPQQITQINIKSSEDKFTPKELLWKYLSYLPYFILSIVLTVSAGVFINRYTPRLYKVETRVFVKSNKDNKIGGASRSSGEGDLIESALFSSKQINLDNEIVLISRAPLMQKIVQSHHFNYHYYNEGSIRTSEIYDTAPFEVQALRWADSTKISEFKLYNLSKNGVDIVCLQNDLEKKQTVSWNKPFKINGSDLVLRLKTPFDQLNKNEQTYLFTYKPAILTTSEILAGFTATPYSAKTTIIKLELKGGSVAKLSAILDALVIQYNNESLEDKSTVINNTINFINQRLGYVTKELGLVETDLKEFKNTNKLIDITTQSGFAMSEKNGLEREYTAFGVKEQLFKMLAQQIRKMPLNELKVIPSAIWIESKDQKLSSFDAYNTLVLKKLRDEPMLGKNSPILADLNLQIQNAYRAVLQTLTDYESTLQVERTALKDRMRKFDNLVGQVPEKEKTFVEIKRQQSVKEGLYLYLLQKREESAIASSTAIGNYEQLEPAGGSNTPIEPSSQKNLLFAFILGLLIPVGIIYLKDLFDDKLRNREHITTRTKMPIIAEIGHIVNLDNNLVVADKSRNLIAEQFRILRTNLNFLLQDKKTILVTSTVSGEGKSFVALNLAAVLAISGKKVALLEFDLRKPRIIKNVGLEKRSLGLSNYLAKQTDDLDTLYYTMEKYPSLHVYGCGPIPPNPAELMMGERMEQLFDYLKSNYDYVVVDTAPVGLVSDAYTMSKHFDSCLYVVRQRKTLKKQLFFIDEIYTSNQLKNVGMVINDVKVGAKHGYYGHHYGYGYGYGYGQRSYGEYFDTDVKEPRLIQIFKKIKRVFKKPSSNKRKTY